MTVEEGWLPPLTSDQHMQPIRHSIHHCSTHCTARPLYPIWEIGVGAPVDASTKMACGYVARELAASNGTEERHPDAAQATLTNEPSARRRRQQVSSSKQAPPQRISPPPHLDSF